MKTKSTLLVLAIAAVSFFSFTGDPIFIKFKPADPKVNESIMFSASHHSDAYYTWDFGDGSDKLHGVASTTNHTYTKPGTYKVSARCSDGEIAYELVMVGQ